MRQRSQPEAMVFCHKISKSRSDVIFVSNSCHPQIIDVIQTRAEPIGIKVVIGDEKEALKSGFRGFIAISIH